MQTISLADAQSQLPNLIRSLQPGEELVITENQVPVARLVGESAAPSKSKRQLGAMSGSVLYMAPDFDAPLDEFRDYMK